MDVAVQLVVEVVVALVLQRGAASGTLEAFHVQVLVLDAHEHTAIEGEEGTKLINLLTAGGKVKVNVSVKGVMIKPGR